MCRLWMKWLIECAKERVAAQTTSISVSKLKRPWVKKPEPAAQQGLLKFLRNGNCGSLSVLVFLFFFAIKLLITGIQHIILQPGNHLQRVASFHVVFSFFFKETTAFDLNNGCFLSGGCHRADLWNSREPSTWVAGGGRAKGGEGQGEPFMSVHLRERRERFWGNAVKMHTALGGEGRGESRPQEWSWPLSMAWEGLQGLSTRKKPPPANVYKDKHRLAGFDSGAHFRGSFTVPFAWLIEACLSRNTSQLSHGSPPPNPRLQAGRTAWSRWDLHAADMFVVAHVFFQQVWEPPSPPPPSFWGVWVGRVESSCFRPPV